MNTAAILRFEPREISLREAIRVIAAEHPQWLVTGYRDDKFGWLATAFHPQSGEWLAGRWTSSGWAILRENGERVALSASLIAALRSALAGIT